ncbi:MAG: hypothetical protein ABFD16_09350 [Thermoguttaceae bacterium]|jgi:hypothetical protein
MSSLGKTMCRGQSGKVYRFKVYPLGTRLRKLGGLYVITSRFRNADGGYRHVPLYVGQSEDFSRPFKQHRGAENIQHHGGNCICIQLDDSEESRLAKQQDLIATYHPLCNGEG